MQLGTETGSLVNHLYSRTKPTEPEVGMAATILSWSDRHPATVIKTFKKGKYNYFVVQEDDAKRTDKLGMSDHQEYEYSRNPNGCAYTYRVEGDNYVRVYKGETGRYRKTSGNIMLGRREKFHDFSF